MILDYTTYDDVRAVLGVEEDELENETLGLQIYASGLESDLYDLNPSFTVLYTDIKVKDEATRTDIEKRVLSLSTAFATFSVAKQLSYSLSMFAPRSIADGKSTLTRFSGEPYQDVIDYVNSQYMLARSRLQAALDELLTQTRASAAASIFFAVSPNYDPVTGE